MPSLSVCILNYNGKDYLEDCLKSVGDIDVERILVDNASTDNSWKIAKKYGFRVVHADNKHQFITGINTALKSATQSTILFSQGDVRFIGDTIYSLYVNCPQWAIVQPVFINDKRGIDNAGMKLIWPAYGIGKRRFARQWNELTDVCTSITFCTTRKVLDAVGYYDENFAPAYLEDIDWAIRSKKIGVNHIVAGNAIVNHLHNQSFSVNYSKLSISNICRKNRRYLINKHYSGFDWLVRTAVSSSLDIGKKAIDVIADRWIAANNRKKNVV